MTWLSTSIANRVFEGQAIKFALKQRVTPTDEVADEGLASIVATLISSVAWVGWNWITRTWSGRGAVAITIIAAYAMAGHAELLRPAKKNIFDKIAASKKWQWPFSDGDPFANFCGCTEAYCYKTVIDRATLNGISDTLTRTYLLYEIRYCR